MAATFPKPGPAGASDAPFVYDVTDPSSLITINHGLNRELVSVTAYDPSGAEVEVGVAVVDANTVAVTTEPGLPFSGKVLVI